MDNLNIQNPFIGLRTYEETDAIFFRGRKSATSDLYELILKNDVVVLHAESGEGKSSLLNAGLFPILRDERFFPIKINFTEEDYALENPDFDEIVYRRIIDEINQINGNSLSTPVFQELQTLNGKVSFTPVDGNDRSLYDNNNLRQCIWWLLRNYTISTYGATLIPVLVFDQFEEVFTRPKSNAWTEDFFLWLSTTLNDTIPQNVIDLIRITMGDDIEFPKIRFDKKFKALFSLRTEYMGELDYWGIQRHHISVLKNSRYCLKPLTDEEADEVLELQPLFTSRIRNQIKAAIESSDGSKRIRSNLPTIPAMLLSVVGATVTENIVRDGHSVETVSGIGTSDISSDVFTSIIEQFYQKEISDANIPKKEIRQIEQVLVDDKGKRVRIKANSKDLQKFDFEDKYKSILEQKRLIKCTQINGDVYVELTHDALAKVIMKRRDIDRLDKSRWTNNILSVLYGVMVFVAILYWFSFLAKDYLYGGFDAVREWHYISTNLFKKIAIAVGFAFIIWRGYRRCVSSDNVQRRILVVIITYIGISLFYWGTIYLIDVTVYPHHTWIYNSFSGRLGHVAFFIVGNILLLWVGCKLLICKKFVKNFRWPVLFGLPIVLATVFWYIYAIGPIASYILLTFAIFKCSSCIFEKGRNSYLLYIISSVLIILSYILYSPYGRLPKYCIGAMVALNISFLVYSLYCKRQLNLYVTLKDLFINNHNWDRNVSKLFGIYAISTICFLGVSIGYKLNDIYSLIGLIVSSILVIHLLSKYILPIQNKVKLITLYTICLLSVLVIWGVQYVSIHFYAILIVWPLGIISIMLISAKLAKSESHKSSYSISKSNINSLLIYAIAVIFLPFLLMGYNILAFNYTSKVFNRSEYIKGVDTKLLYVKNENGQIGLMNRNGSLIIPVEYDQIIPNFCTSYENFWDDNHTTKTEFVGFILIKDWQLFEWNLSGNIQNGALLTYAESNNLIDVDDKNQEVDTTIEENKIKKQIVKLIKENIQSDLLSSKWRFNYKDVAHLKMLHCIDCDSINPDLLATSVAFQKCYLDTILPNLNFGGYGLVSDVLSPTYDWGKALEQKAREIENSDGYKKIISDKITGRMLVKKELGGKLANLAHLYLICGRFDTAETISKLSFTQGKYHDCGKVDYLTALLNQGKIDEALDFVRSSDNELFNENPGIFPEQEYAWINIRYTPIIWHLNKHERDQLLNNGYSFKIEGLLPFQHIQHLPDSVNGDMYRFYCDFPIPGGFGRTYSYFVKNRQRVTPPLSFWSISQEVGDPILAINCITKKRQFIKSKDIIGDAYAIEPIYGDDIYPKFAYSQKYINMLDPSEYRITKSYRHSGNHPSTFISPKLLNGEYDHAWPFSEGLAAVEIEGRIGFINREGKILIEPKFYSPFKTCNGFLGSFYNIYSSGNHYNPYFRNGKCPVYNESGKLIWINKNGDVTTEPIDLPPKGIL